MTRPRSEFHEFLEVPEQRRLYEQERLLVDTNELLVRIMEKQGISRANLAKRLGKSKAFITQVLRGKRNLTLRTLADLFGAMECRLVMEALPWQGAIPSIPEFDYLSESSCYGLSSVAYKWAVRTFPLESLPLDFKKPAMKRTVLMDVLLSQGGAA
jgi:transcriptional regulator with XRE-family HTH domain